MKRLFAIFCITSVLLCGCGSYVSEEEYERVVAEKDAIYEKYNALVADYAILESQSKSKQETLSEDTENVTEKFTEEAVEETLGQNKLAFSYDDMDVEFVEYKIEKNSVGDKCLVLYFNFTNNTDENQTFLYCFSVDAFQNGLSLDSSMFHVNETTKNHSREIQPGTTITVASSFILTDDTSIVDIEIEPWSALYEEKLLEFRIELKQE